MNDLKQKARALIERAFKYKVRSLKNVGTKDEPIYQAKIGTNIIQINYADPFDEHSPLIDVTAYRHDGRRICYLAYFEDTLEIAKTNTILETMKYTERLCRACAIEYPFDFAELADLARGEKAAIAEKERG